MDKQKINCQTQTVKDRYVTVESDPVPSGWQYNRVLAAVVLAVVVAFSAMLGIGKGVRKEYRQVTEIYAEGVDNSGYGIAYYANGMLEHAANLCKIAEKSRYQDAFQAEAKNVRTQMDAFRTLGETDGRYDALLSLIDSVDALNMELSDYEMEATDDTLRQAEYQNFTDQFYKLRNVAVDYNETVREYNDKVLHRFPASLFRGLLHLPEAEEFS